MARLLPVAALLLAVLVLASPGLKIVIASQLYQSSWGNQVELPAVNVAQDTQMKADTTYGAVTIYSVGGWQWDIQNTVNKVVTDAVKAINDKGLQPLYVEANAENVSCTLSYCQYGVRLTTQFHTAANQQEIITYVIIVIILIIVAILFYLAYKGVVSTEQFLASNPVTTGLLAALVAVAIAVIFVIYARRKQN